MSKHFDHGRAWKSARTGGCAGLAVAIVVGLAAHLHSAVLLAGTVVGAVLGLGLSLAEQDGEEQKREEARRWVQEQEKEEIRARGRMAQVAYGAELLSIGQQALGIYEDLPRYLVSADGFLDQAAIDFDEGAFAPFWDSVEGAAMALAKFDAHVGLVGDRLSRYGELVRLYEGSPPHFPLTGDSIEGLTASGKTVARLDDTVRKAQRDFQFASIYEQRRTNQVLIAGFNNLGQALAGLSRRLEHSLDNLAGRIDDLSTTVVGSIESLGERLEKSEQATTEAINAFRTDIDAAGVDWKARHDRTLEILNDIRYRRRPVHEPLSDRLGKKQL